MGKKIVVQTTPTDSAKILFAGSGYQFAQKTLKRLADGKTCDKEETLFVQRFLGNALLMVTHYAWAGNGWGVGPFAHLIYKNNHLRDTLKEMMPFERSDILPRIRANWPNQVAELFNDFATTPQQQRLIKGLVNSHQTRGKTYDSIALYIGQTSPRGRKMVQGRLMHARFRLVDNLLPLPDLTPENAQKILAAIKTSKQPNSNPTDVFGVPYISGRDSKGPF